MDDCPLPLTEVNQALLHSTHSDALLRFVFVHLKLVKRLDCPDGCGARKDLRFRNVPLLSLL